MIDIASLVLICVDDLGDDLGHGALSEAALEEFGELSSVQMVGVRQGAIKIDIAQMFRRAPGQRQFGLYREEICKRTAR